MRSADAQSTDFVSGYFLNRLPICPGDRLKQIILAQIQEKIAASGISAATCARAFGWAALAGIVIECTDWKNVWDAVFNRDQFFEDRYITMANPISSAIVNYTNLDDKFTDLMKAVDNTFYDGKAMWDYDYIETTNRGWQVMSDWAKDIFGRVAGKLNLKQVETIEALGLSGCTYWKTVPYYDDIIVDIYYAPLGWIYTKADDNWVKSYINKWGYRDATTKQKEGGIPNKDNCALMINVFSRDPSPGSSNSGEVQFGFLNEDYLSKTDYNTVWTNLYFYATREEFGLPPMPYTNNIPYDEVMIEDLIPEGEEHVPLIFYLPSFTPDPNKTDEENLIDYIGMFPDTPIVPKLANEPELTPEPTPQPSPEPSPEPTPEPQPEPGPGW